MLHSVLQGFLVGIGLIIAIGAQNAFVLKQGLKQQYIFWVCLVCVISDSLLIFAGVFGFAAVLQAHANWVEMAKYFGAIFLFLYGLQHFYHAWSKQQYLVAAGKEESSLLRVLLLCLALTWLNPHVYLDTVVLIGSISTQIQGSKLDFALGASLASFLFFFSLGYGAKYLQPLFQDYRAWKVLDVGIGCLMWGIAYRLII
ncbi:MAG: LysE/ArgO family amino acid transporter [Acinetobacter sp.]|uniref:LysE/ArgO family amino acid transporter n=1 Tax=Acinetobacter sp. TaxID=472 RepID=UPI0026DFD065|nr:LysE/ArgO family amino acid transporter [Acinetobacter sp.]MDO5542312.1 LysE/ArgO family amino acid transporter [Acinetobacter sp.]